jgi:metallo-beta-lactamase class B
MRRLLVLIFAMTVLVPLGRTENPADWTTPLAPFKIADNLYYVGSRDLAAFLVTTPKGNVLINANLQSSPPQIRASVETLGFRWSDTKILLNSQAHFDHAAGIAEVMHETHALNEVMDGDVESMESGGRRNFAFGDDITTDFAPAHVDRVLHDGDKIVLGGVTIVAHKTAGHTQGCTTFTLDTHIPGEPAGKLRHVVIVGGWAPLPHYRLIDAAGKKSSYAGIDADFRHTFATLYTLPCDIFLGAHGLYFDLLAKVARMKTDGPQVFIDRAGYQAAVKDAEANYKAMYAKQRGTIAPR